MRMQPFLFTQTFPSLERVSPELRRILQNLDGEKGINRENHVSFLAYIYANWGTSEKLHVISYIFDEDEDKLEAAKAQLASLKKTQEENNHVRFSDEYLEGLIKCAKHLIELLAKEYYVSTLNSLNK